MGTAFGSLTNYERTGEHGVEHICQLTQQQIATLIRNGLDVDLVINPYQVSRLSDDSADARVPELKEGMSVLNPGYVEPKSISVDVSSSSAASSPAVADASRLASTKSKCLKFIFSSTVPSFVTLSFCVVEGTDPIGYPCFTPMQSHPEASNGYRLSMNPGLRQEIRVPLPETFIQLIATSPGWLTAAEMTPTFHHVVIAVEPAIPLPPPVLDPDDRNHYLRSDTGVDPRDVQTNEEPNLYRHRGTHGTQELGYCTAQWTFVRLQGSGIAPLNVQSGLSPLRARIGSEATGPSSGNASSSPRETRNATEESISVKQVKQTVLAGRLLLELQDIFGLGSSSSSSGATVAEQGREQNLGNQDNLTSGDVESAASRSAGSGAGGSSALVAPAVTGLNTNSTAPDSIIVDVRPLSSVGASISTRADVTAQDCVICMSVPSNAVCLPCRHLCTCAPCARALLSQSGAGAKCPICRERIASILSL